MEKIKLRYRAEIEITMETPSDTPGLLPIEEIKEEVDSTYEEAVRGIIYDEIDPSQNPYVTVKTLEADVWKEET